MAKENNAFKITSDKNTRVIIQATNQKLLASVVSNFIKSLKKKKKSIALAIVSNCGCKRNYIKVKDIPKRSVRCKHGIYFIKYVSNIK